VITINTAGYYYIFSNVLITVPTSGVFVGNYLASTTNIGMYQKAMKPIASSSLQTATGSFFGYIAAGTTFVNTFNSGDNSYFAENETNSVLTIFRVA